MCGSTFIFIPTAMPGLLELQNDCQWHYRYGLAMSFRTEILIQNVWSCKSDSWCCSSDPSMHSSSVTSLLSTLSFLTAQNCLTVIQKQISAGFFVWHKSFIQPNILGIITCHFMSFWAFPKMWLFDKSCSFSNCDILVLETFYLPTDH